MTRGGDRVSSQGSRWRGGAYATRGGRQAAEMRNERLCLSFSAFPLKRDEQRQPVRLSGPSRLAVVGAHTPATP